MKICLKNVSIISVNNGVEVKRAGDVVFENNKIFYEKNNLENCDKVVRDENLVILPKFNYFNVESRTNKINNVQYDFFNLENVRSMFRVLNYFFFFLLMHNLRILIAF